MFQVTLTWTDTAMRASVAAMHERAGDLSVFFTTRIRPDLTTLLEQQFASDGAAMWHGARWARLAPSTIARKRSDSILRDTQQMFEALVNPSATDGLEVVTPSSYTRGATGGAADKMGWATGGDPARGRPARPVFGSGIPMPVTQAWTEQLASFLISGVVPGASSAL